jgi:replicative DNA helicase
VAKQTGGKEIASPLPRSDEAERAVLGAILIDNNAAVEVFGSLPAEDFMDERHQHIYRAMEACGDAIDIVPLVDTLEKMGKLHAAGGAPYIASLADGMQRVSNIGSYVGIVREKAQRRKIVHLSGGTEKSAMGNQDTANEILERLVQDALAILSDTRETPKVWEWADAATSATKAVHHAAYHPEEQTRLAFGLKELDEIVGGLRRREKVVLVGESSHGKSLLAAQLASFSESNGYKGLLFSAEMSKEAITLREVSYEAKVPLYLTRRPEKLEGRMDLITALHQAASRTRNLAIVDKGITPARIWALSEARKRTKGLDFVIVDYDQLVIRAGMQKDDDFYAEQGEFMLQFSKFADRLDICPILLSQPRKVDRDIAQGKRAPRLSDIFGSSAVGNTADVVLWVMRDYFMYDQDVNYKKKARVHVIKARNDQTGHVKLGFDPQGPRFTDADAESEPVPERRGRRKRS